jgi:hypothetical protein
METYGIRSSGRGGTIDDFKVENGEVFDVSIVFPLCFPM